MVVETYMHFTCKLIPSLSLSHQELEYILTPDEVVRLLSREKNSQNIVKSLPSPLRESLALSSTKNVHSLLTALNQKLVRGEWIAISTAKRTKALSDTQLVQYPQLNKHMVRVSETQSTKYVKANFQAVTDDVVLSRSLQYTPVEPRPENKIVVEFAGQWPNNAASLLLAKSDEQKEKITKPRADIHVAHRSIAIFKDLEPEPRNLYLTIPMNGTPQPLKLLLAENIEPVEKKTEMDEWDNVLVPVRPLAYLTGDKNKSNAAELQGGYVYLFWKNTLWREFYIDKNGYYQDIDVEYHRRLFDEEKNKPKPKILKREPDGLPLAQFWVPYKIAGDVQQGESGLKLFFSPKQKPFSQIEALESDPAKLNKVSSSLDELSHYSDAQSFSALEFTSDVDSAVVHDITKDDMPWFSDKQAVLRSLDKSNIVIAYLDGHNNGFQVRLEVNDIDRQIPESELDAWEYNGLIAILEDEESDWRVNEAFEPVIHNGYISALITDIPPKGKFTLYFANRHGEDSLVTLFKGLTYQEMVANDLELDAPEPAQPVELDEQQLGLIKASNDQRTAMQKLIFGQ